MLRLLLFVAAAQVAAALACFAAGVPLGKPGTFTYLYSPFAWERLTSRGFATGLLLACLSVLATRLALSPDLPRRSFGVRALMLSWPAWAAWAFLAPPLFIHTHAFNMLSPSHDGAFLREAAAMASPTEYLRDFPQRARTPPEEMKGTRVISNPPGATLLAWVTLRGLGDSRFADELLLRATPQAREMTWSERTLIRRALVFAAVLQLAWLAAAPALYLLARRWFEPSAAAVLATLVFLSPATVLFSPGKDPAQLLSVALPLLLWIVALRGSRVSAVAAGAAFVAALVVGLVHAWAALVALAASAWSAIGASPASPAALRTLVRGSLLALAGSLAAGLLLFGGCGLNLPAALLAAAKSQAEVTRGAHAMPATWQMLGLPLFLLFCGPAVPALIGWLRFGRLGGRPQPSGGMQSSGETQRGGGMQPSGGAQPTAAARPFAATQAHAATQPFAAVDACDAGVRFGEGLLIASVLVMVCTVAFTNAETPRLWIPFMPLLIFGAALQLPHFRRHPATPGEAAVSSAGAAARVGAAPCGAPLLVALVAAQLSVTLAQWLLMDMREAETRLLLDPSGAARFFH